MKSVILKEVIKKPGTKFIFHGDVENKGIVTYVVLQNNNPTIINLSTGKASKVPEESLNKPITIMTNF